MGKLFLGVAREVITPTVGAQLFGYRPDTISEKVEDDLTVTAFYFKQGDKQALMLSATVGNIQTELAKNILTLIEKRFGVPSENCMLSATHTHSGPNTAGMYGWGDVDQEYCEQIFKPAILKVIEKAINSIQSVRMGTSTGTSLIGINRRELTEFNTIELGQNPWGPFNPQMTLISFANENGEVIANIIHYGVHCTAAGPNHEITRDLAGVMIDALEEYSGAVTAFFNGPEGDVGPRLSNKLTQGDLNHVYEIGAIAARDAVRIFDNIKEYIDADLNTSHCNLEIPLKQRMSLEDAKLMYEDYKDYTVNREGKIRKHLEDVINSYGNDYAEKEVYEIKQTVFSIGDIVFVSFAYELFSEIGMRIAKSFSNKTILSLSNTNGTEGYFITEDTKCRGGYEVDMFMYGDIQPYCDNADFQLVKQTIQHIKKIESED